MSPAFISQLDNGMVLLPERPPGKLVKMPMMRESLDLVGATMVASERLLLKALKAGSGSGVEIGHLEITQIALKS